MIESDGLYFIEYNDEIETVDLEIDSVLKSSYYEIIKYFRITSKIPSLACLNDDLKVLYSNFLQLYIDQLESIQEGSYLTKQQKNLFKIGVIKREIEDREILLTPLHPLNMAFQLHLHENIENEEMDDEIAKKFTSTYLLPYILDDNGRIYIPMEQFHSPEWKYYVEETLPRYKVQETLLQSWYKKR